MPKRFVCVGSLAAILILETGRNPTLQTVHSSGEEVPHPRMPKAVSAGRGRSAWGPLGPGPPAPRMPRVPYVHTYELVHMRA